MDSKETNLKEYQRDQSRILVKRLLVVLRRYVLRDQDYDKNRWGLISEIIKEGIRILNNEGEDPLKAESLEEFYDMMVKDNDFAVREFEWHFQEI